MYTIVNLLKANIFFGKSAADLDPAVLPSYTGVSRYPSYLEVVRVIEVVQLLRHASWGRNIDRGRGLLQKSFMRPFGIVLLPEEIEALLL